MANNNEMKAQIVVDLDEKGVVIGARKVIQNTDKMTTKIVNGTKKQMSYYQKMNKELSNTSKNMTGFAAKIAATYGGVQAIKMVWEFNDGLKDNARRLGWSTEKIDQQKQSLFDLEMEYGLIRNELSQYVNEVMRGVKSTEDFEDKLKLGAIAMRGLGLSGADAAKMLEKFDSIGVSNPEAMMDVFANIGQAKNGRFRADEIAMGSVEIMGKNSLSQDPETMKQVGAMLQALSADGAPISDAVTQLNSIISDFSSGSFREFAKARTGQDVFDVQDDKLVLKNLQSLIDIMAEDTKNGEVKNKLWYDQLRTLQGRLSADAASGIQSLAGKGEAVQQIKKSQGVSANQTALDRSRNFDASMSKLMATMQRFADMNLADPIERFAIAMSQLEPTDIQNILDEAEKGAKALASILAVFAGTKALQSISITNAGTIAMAITGGVLAINYLSEKANERLDRKTETINDISSMLTDKIAIPYKAATGKSINFEDVNKIVESLEHEKMLRPDITEDELLNKAINMFINLDQRRMAEKIREGSSFFGQLRVPFHTDQDQMTTELAKGKDNAYGIHESLAKELYNSLQTSINHTRQLSELKVKPQKLEVTTESVVKIENNTPYKTTVVEKGSTVKDKLGYTGGGDY